MQQERIEKNYTSLCEQEDWTLRSLKPVWNRDARIIYSFPVFGVKKIRRKRYEERMIWESKKKKKKKERKGRIKAGISLRIRRKRRFHAEISITRTWYLSIRLYNLPNNNVCIVFSFRVKDLPIKFPSLLRKSKEILPYHDCFNSYIQL